METGERKKIHDAIGKLSSGLVIAADVNESWAIVRSADPAERMWYVSNSTTRSFKESSDHMIYSLDSGSRARTLVFVVNPIPCGCMRRV